MKNLLKRLGSISDKHFLRNAAVGLILVSTSISFAGETVISETLVTVPVTINSSFVKFSKADYSLPVVKVLVPGIADVSILDHRNRGEGAPCLAAYETKRPEDVIQNNPGTEDTEFRITLTKIALIDSENKCQVSLREDIAGVIRGHNFVHSREVPIGKRHVDDCR